MNGLIIVCVGVLVCVAGQQILTGEDGTMFGNARPDPPYDVQGDNVTYNSIDVVWTSGSDDGARQQFNIIRYLGNSTNTYQTFATNISGAYNDSGSGQNWTYHLAGLYSDTDYRLAVQAQNKYGTSTSEITIIRTSENDTKPNYTQIYVAIFVSISVVLSLLVFVIYIITKRIRRASHHVSTLPEPPYGVQGCNVTYNSIDVVWTSGSDEGARQHFNIIRYLGNGNSTFQILATNISGAYKDTGSGQNWTYHLGGLNSATDYRLAVQAHNKYGTSVSEITLIRTSKYPNDQKLDYTDMYVAIALSVSAGLSLLAMVIYIIKRRRVRRHVTSRSGLIQSWNDY